LVSKINFGFLSPAKGVQNLFWALGSPKFILGAWESKIYFGRLGVQNKRLLLQYRTEGIRAFNLSVFKLMENAHKAFRTLVEFLYEANSKGSGVLVFPHYSPLKLHFNRKNIQTTKDMTLYMESLVKKLQVDIQRYLKRNVDLTEKNQELLKKITHDGLLSEKLSKRFDPRDYNKIIKRVRDFWLTYFLQELYKCQSSMTTFDSF
jgi:hypothetical protein